MNGSYENEQAPYGPAGQQSLDNGSRAGSSRMLQNGAERRNQEA